MTNLKDMSNEELLLKYKKCVKGKFYITDIEPELLSRLQAGERAIKAIINKDIMEMDKICREVKK